ncbi:MAG: hypothetical protein ABIR98_13160 [Usitatibacter sp.]
MNGAGKSSIGGAMVRASGCDYYNPDEAARLIIAANPRLSRPQANSLAWDKGRDLLERAIATRQDFTFASTLGASTIPAMLDKAADAGGRVHIWYVGLDSPERHIARVRARVKAGGHDISEADIRRRYEASRQNLVWLTPKLASLHIYDNSFEGDLVAGKAPRLKPVLHLEGGQIVGPEDLRTTPGWAKPLVARAMLVAVARKRASR